MSSAFGLLDKNFHGNKYNYGAKIKPVNLKGRNGFLQ